MAPPRVKRALLKVWRRQTDLGWPAPGPGRNKALRLRDLADRLWDHLVRRVVLAAAGL